jgi:PilZ domain-containing protein
MGQERRKHPRVAVPIDGQWHAAATGHFCRVLNISLGGCFARSPATPPPEGPATMTMYFGKHGPMTVKGSVVHAEPKRGFGFQFQDLRLEVRFQLGEHLESLKTGNY